MEQVIINSLYDLEHYIDKLKQIKIWVCNTACGKSYICSLDDRFFDLDAYRSQLHNSGIENFEDETIPKMWQMIDSEKIILNAAHSHFLNYLGKTGIPFVYMYGKPEVQSEYIERMRHRGNDEEFIQKFGSLIALHYADRAKDKRGNFKIEMNSKEFASDYIWKVFGMPKKYIQCNNFAFSQFKMAFIDIDGTLLNRENKLSEFTKNTIKLISKRVKIVLTTGRGPDSILPVLKELDLTCEDNFAICYNGAIILKNGKVVK